MRLTGWKVKLKSAISSQLHCGRSSKKLSESILEITCTWPSVVVDNPACDCEEPQSAAVSTTTQTENAASEFLWITLTDAVKSSPYFLKYLNHRGR